jgi:hypothetical protein
MPFAAYQGRFVFKKRRTAENYLKPFRRLSKVAFKFNFSTFSLESYWISISSLVRFYGVSYEDQAEFVVQRPFFRIYTEYMDQGCVVDAIKVVQAKDKYLHLHVSVIVAFAFAFLSCFCCCCFFFVSAWCYARECAGSNGISSEESAFKLLHPVVICYCVIRFYGVWPIWHTKNVPMA